MLQKRAGIKAVLGEDKEIKVKQMSKEKLTLNAIKKDLCRYAEWQLYKKGSPSLGLFVAFLALAVVLGIYLQNVWISMIVLLPAAFFYH